MQYRYSFDLQTPVCCIIKPTEYILSTVSFQWTKNFDHKSLYLQMGTCSPVRTSYGKALEQYNSVGPLMFYHSLLYWMNALPRATHLFRQSSKPKFYTDPDLKCFQSFMSSLHIFEAILPQCLLYERYANLNCSKSITAMHFLTAVYCTYRLPGKKIQLNPKMLCWFRPNKAQQMATKDN